MVPEERKELVSAKVDCLEVIAMVSDFPVLLMVLMGKAKLALAGFSEGEAILPDTTQLKSSVSIQFR